MTVAAGGAATAWARADALAAEAILTAHRPHDAPIIVGLAGAQGSGKSTMAPRLERHLARSGLRAAVLSLDDFYLTRAERAALARTVHPLLATRGVPGTHDLGLLTETIDALLGGAAEVAIPRFDKAADDRAAPAEWTRLVPPFDVVLLEGWCIGARPQSAAELGVPVNDYERTRDAEGIWRTWVNARLATDYSALFERLALRIYLRAPDFSVVRHWRSEQEATLERRTGRRGLSENELLAFVAFYERITRAMLAAPPAELVIELDANRVPQL